MIQVEKILRQKLLIIISVLILALVGLASVFTMPRQEDPRLDDYWGIVITRFPGADAEKVEHLVADPIEENLAEVEEIKLLESTIRADVLITEIELVNPQPSVDEAWDEVRRALEKAGRDFPQSAGEPVLDRDLREPESVVLALTGSVDPVVLADAAEVLKKEFLSLRDVTRVKLIGDQGEQVTVELEDSNARRLGIAPHVLAGQLTARNLTVSGGTVKLGGKRMIVRFNDEFQTVAEIARTPIMLPSGAAIPLSEIAGVRRGPAEPLSEKMRFNGSLAVGLGIVPRKGINLVEYGKTVQDKLTEVRNRFPGLELHMVAFQPDRVRSRLEGLGQSLLLAVAIVAGVLILTIGPSLGLIVASVVPLVALSSLALFNWWGGVLHQISIAAFVIALGMLVDNAIVVGENIKRRIDSGEPRSEAGPKAVKELALPLAASTLTSLAAFVPMLLAASTAGDFTRSLPIIIMMTLSVSYVFAMTVTPIVSSRFLKRSGTADRSKLGRVTEILAHTALNRTKWVLSAALVLMTASVFGSTLVERQFFPLSDRNQLVLELRFLEGAHIDEVDAAAVRIESELRRRTDVKSFATFVGRSAPDFYYNIPRQPSSPHLAQILVKTDSVSSVDDVVRWAREFSRTSLAGLRVVGKKLEQGPPVEDPVEIRVLGWDHKDLHQSAEMIMASLRKIPGAVDVVHDVGVGIPTIRFEIDDAAAARHGLSRSDVALAVSGRTLGLDAGSYRGGEDPVPVVIRSAAGETYGAGELSSIDASVLGGKPVPVSQIARSRVEWLPASIYHRNRKRVVTVASQLAPGATYSRVLDSLRPQLDAMKFPNGIKIEIGGVAETSDESNLAMFRALPAGLVMLILVLVAEFNSLRRAVLVMVTIPLAAAGVVPGLIIGGQPFGFMSLLGTFALAGVVVNNAIVLIDRIEQERRKGLGVSEALTEAIRLRTRPILLTSTTTVCGLLPLALSSSNLWPPMAWAMISGLTASTGLTLLVVPALYKVMFSWRENAGGSLPTT
jgi:multidrug efflux pump